MTHSLHAGHTQSKLRSGETLTFKALPALQKYDNEVMYPSYEVTYSLYIGNTQGNLRSGEIMLGFESISAHQKYGKRRKNEIFYTPDGVKYFLKSNKSEKQL